MKKSDYSFILISIITFLLLNFNLENTYHKYIIFIGKLFNIYPGFSSTSIDVLLLSLIPFLSYILIRNNFLLLDLFKNLIYFYIIITIMMMIFICISPFIFKFENPLIPKYIIPIGFKYYFTIAIYFGILISFFLMRFLLRRNDKKI
jgi:hypothetical protein